MTRAEEITETERKRNERFQVLEMAEKIMEHVEDVEEGAELYDIIRDVEKYIETGKI